MLHQNSSLDKLKKHMGKIYRGSRVLNHFIVHLNHEQFTEKNSGLVSKLNVYE